MLIDDIGQQAIDRVLDSLLESEKGQKRYKAYQHKLKLLKLPKSGKQEIDLRIECLACGDTKKAHLQFHHLNPKYKESVISAIPKTQSLKLLKELEKCIVLCANCHIDFHDDVTKVHVAIVNEMSSD